MTWSFDVAKRQYVDGERTVTQAELIALRNTVANGMADEAETLAQRLISGAISLVEWAKAFAALIRNGIAAGFLLGRGGRSQIDRAALTLLDTLIGAQLDYAKGFATELAPSLTAGTATAEGVAARSSLYAGASVQAFDQGRAQAWSLDLPYYPADGQTSCGGNCRCEWSIDNLDDRIEATWHTEGDGKVCDGCRARGNKYGPGSPFVQRKDAT